MIDLHTHSTCSDGTLEPEELVERAKKNGVEAMALTDHDTFDGIKRARKKAEELGIEFICGIEFSTDYDGKDIHVLGYFIDENNPKVNSKLKELKKEREERTYKIIEKLNQLKLKLTIEEVMEEVTGDLISRTHIASAMMKKGYVYRRSEAFNQYLGMRGRAYFPKEGLKTVDAVKMIREAGGFSSLAHPKLIPYGHEKMLQLIDELKENGLDALEIYYPNFSLKDIAYYKRIAEERDLLFTGGSDFHGLNREGIDVACSGIDKELFQKIKNKHFKGKV